MSSSFTLTLPSGANCECLVRVSRRSKNVCVRFSELRGLELVAPPFSSIEAAKAFAVRSAPWIERVLKRRAAQSAEREARRGLEKPLPELLELKASGESYPVDYLDDRKLGFVSVRIETPGRLLAQGDLSDVPACRAAIVGWLRLKAERLFIRTAAEVAAECGLSCKSVKVRDQKGRWGSCSREGRINLNFRLLLLEPRFLRHVIVHELCHTAELNHSARFWRKVEEFEPDAKRVRAELAEAAKELPSWLSESSSSVRS